MKISIYQVDAFASRLFEGNPAAVCPLQDWPEDSLLQAIAEENNLSETAFFVPSGEGFQLRWFTPLREIELCGHATLAAAHVLFSLLEHRRNSIDFDTRSGVLTVKRNGEKLSMCFPASIPQPCFPSALLTEALGAHPVEVLAAEDFIAVYPDESSVRALSPNFALLARLGLRGVAVTAPGGEVDFVSRFFAPKYGIEEDPVTGSAHCELAPYWSARLEKKALTAKQVSRRGGIIECSVEGHTVVLTGGAMTYMQGELDIPETRNE